MKATSLFGGVQLFTIIVQVIRSKAVAVLLGPAGMGMMGLFMSTLSVIGSATNFGLSISAVRDISEADASGNHEKITNTVTVVRKLLWLTGLLGLIVCVVGAPFLSDLTFGNSEYTYAFIALSVTLLCNQLAAGQSVILQGLRKLNWLAQANILSAVFGLFTSLPLFYFFGMQGIVPAIILNAVIVMAVQYYFSARVAVQSKAITFKQALQNGKNILKLGFMLSLSSVITLSVSYIIKLFITRTGGLSEVGLYDAGFALINNYVGMVFAAMATDYYPRLAAVHNNVKESNKLVSHQSEIALFILAPLICIFLVFINLVIVVLYSEKFLPLSEMVHWAMLGIFFKSVSWALGFLLLAKGASKAFFWNEVLSNVYILVLNCIGYYYAGLEGIGISFLISYFLYFLQIYFFSRLRYSFRFSGKFFLILALYFVLGVVCYYISTSFSGLKLYVLGSIMIAAVALVSLFFINRRMDLLSVLNQKFRK